MKTINKNEASNVSGGGFGKELGKGLAKVNKFVDTVAKDIGDAAKDAEKNTRKFLHTVRDARDEERDKKDTENVGIPADAKDEL